MRKQTKKQKTQNRKWVRRALYQSLMEQYKKLSRDMKIITAEGICNPDKILLIAKYREQYKRGDDFIRELFDVIKAKKLKGQSNTPKNKYAKDK